MADVLLRPLGQAVDGARQGTLGGRKADGALDHIVSWDRGRACTHRLADSRTLTHTACAHRCTVVQTDTDMERGWHGFSKTAKIPVFPF